MADPRFSVTSFTVAISESVSEAVDLRGSFLGGLWVPTLNGTNSMGLLVGNNVGLTDTSSADYVDLYTTAGDLYAINIGTGSKALSISADVHGFANLKVKLSTAQSAARTFVLITRL